MSLQQIRDLLPRIKELPQLPVPEKTLFSIGGRGYYENPTTDVLAYFCDTNEDHRLGKPVLRALFTSLDLSAEEFPTDLTLASAPERESNTDNNYRIDLLLKGSDWLMVIENKMYHHQESNPFADYEAFAEKHHNQHLQGSRPIYVVLSPNGDSPEGWKGLSYPRLVAALKEELGSHFIEQPFNKWCVYLRDFILHLDQLMSNEPEQKEKTQFVFENLEELTEIESLKKNAYDAVKTRLCRSISEKLGEEVLVKSVIWHQYPGYRFYQEGKQKNLEIVLYFEKGAISLNTYIYSPFSIEKADKHLWRDGMEQWLENKKTIRAYKQILHKGDFEDFDATLENIAEKAHQRLKRLGEYESDLT